MIDYLYLFDGFLLVVATAIAIAVIRMKDLFASIMLAGLYSLLMALVWTNMHAVDVAFTEAAVGAGISTVLLLGAVVICGRQEKKVTRRSNPAALVIVAITGAVLLYGTADMPNFGDANAPIHQYRARALFEQNVGKVRGHPLYTPHDASDSHGHTDADTGHASAGHTPAQHDAPADHGAHEMHDDFHGHVPNTVTSLLADYRSLDTMFETAVVLTAGVSMLILLRRREEDEVALEHTGPAPITKVSATKEPVAKEQQQQQQETHS